MTEDTEILSEVVVTALGIKREEKALGYAVQKLGGEKLATVKTVDVATSLTGKIAGLNVQNSTEFNDAPSLLLRGETPLLVIDGVPYGNMTLRDIPADDIESVDVLKGATAAALYGGYWGGYWGPAWHHHHHYPYWAGNYRVGHTDYRPSRYTGYSSSRRSTSGFGNTSRFTTSSRRGSSSGVGRVVRPGSGAGSSSSTSVRPSGGGSSFQQNGPSSITRPSRGNGSSYVRPSSTVDRTGSIYSRPSSTRRSSNYNNNRSNTRSSSSYSTPRSSGSSFSRGSSSYSRGSATGGSSSRSSSRGGSSSRR